MGYLHLSSTCLYYPGWLLDKLDVRLVQYMYLCVVVLMNTVPFPATFIHQDRHPKSLVRLRICMFVAVNCVMNTVPFPVTFIHAWSCGALLAK